MSQLKQSKTDINLKVVNKNSQETGNEDETDSVHTKRSLDQGTEITSDDCKIVDSIEDGYLSSHAQKESVNNNKGNWKDQNIVDTCHGTEKKEVHGCSRINENSSGGGGALRYALHLRFICPLPKSCRSLQKCKSDPLSKPQRQDMDVERRFYLYNDLRVVFPQRHSDDDEGKVCDSCALLISQHKMKLLL